MNSENEIFLDDYIILLYLNKLYLYLYLGTAFRKIKIGYSISYYYIII